jgi:hypothetical protein
MLHPVDVQYMSQMIDVPFNRISALSVKLHGNFTETALVNIVWV